jgi:preprotein translocase subunit SecE
VLGVRVPPGLPAFFGGNSLFGMCIMNKFLTYLAEVRQELEKVIWPKRSEFIGTVKVVCVVIVILSAVLGSMDLVFNYALKQLLG